MPLLFITTQAGLGISHRCHHNAGQHPPQKEWFTTIDLFSHLQVDGRSAGLGSWLQVCTGQHHRCLFWDQTKWAVATRARPSHGRLPKCKMASSTAQAYGEPLLVTFTNSSLAKANPQPSQSQVGKRVSGRHESRCVLLSQRTENLRE